MATGWSATTGAAAASRRPSAGYDYDTLAADLNALLEALDLRDVVLVGCCAGAGEVVRYLGCYAQRRVRAAALLAPWLDAPSDRMKAGFQREFSARLADDRPAAIKTYLDKHYNLDLLGGGRVSDQAWQNSFNSAIGVARPRP